MTADNLTRLKDSNSLIIRTVIFLQCSKICWEDDHLFLTTRRLNALPCL